MMMQDILYLNSWETPLSNIENKCLGIARIKKIKYPKGYYAMYEINGYSYYYFRRPIWITCLQIKEYQKWRDWMVDDPLHWLGIKQYLDTFQKGSLLCAGLGLGLILHHAVKMLNTNGMIKFSKIRIIEINPDVIKLITPTLPNDARIEIINDDFYHSISNSIYQHYPYDNLLWDLAVGDKNETKRDFKIGKAYCEIYLPKTKCLFFGMKLHE